MPDRKGETRVLAVGDCIAAHPCTVVIESVGTGGATGRCDHCAVEHVIDRHLYESGRGPWRLLLSGSSRADDS